MPGNGGEAEEGWDGRNRSFLAGRHHDFADRYARLGLEFVWFYNVTNHPEHNGPLRGSTDHSILTEPLSRRLQFSMFLGVDWEGEDRSTWHRVVWPHFGRCSTVSHTRRSSNWKRLAFSTDLSPHGMVVYSFWCWEFPQSDASCEPRCRWEDSAALCCCLWSWIRRPLTVLAKDRQGKNILRHICCL